MNAKLLKMVTFKLGGVQGYFNTACWFLAIIATLFVIFSVREPNYGYLSKIIYNNSCSIADHNNTIFSIFNCHDFVLNQGSQCKAADVTTCARFNRPGNRKIWQSKTVFALFAGPKLCRHGGHILFSLKCFFCFYFSSYLFGDKKKQYKFYIKPQPQIFHSTGTYT